MDSTKKTLESFIHAVLSPFVQPSLESSNHANSSAVFGIPRPSSSPVAGTLQSAMSAFYSGQLSSFSSSHPVLCGALGLLAIVLLAVHLIVFRVPSNLRHLPSISPYPVIWSYICKESVDRRVKRLILPIAEQGHGVCLVWMLGKWGVHVIDPEVSSHQTLFIRLAEG